VAGCAGSNTTGSDEAGVSEELPAQDNTELVTFGVREHNMVGISVLPNVNVLGAKTEQPLDDLALVLDGLADQIEMDRVLRGLRFRDRGKIQDEASAIGRQHPDHLVSVVVDLPTQGARPEPGEMSRVVCVEAEGREPSCHLTPPALPNRDEAKRGARAQIARSRAGAASTDRQFCTHVAADALSRKCRGEVAMAGRSERAARVHPESGR
jgi:hypothetical protein